MSISPRQQALSKSGARDPRTVEASIREVRDSLLPNLSDPNRSTGDKLGAAQLIDYFTPERWVEIAKYDPRDVTCLVFGHACPVFLTAENVSETKESRRRSRFVPRGVMIAVVRRDNYLLATVVVKRPT